MNERLLQFLWQFQYFNHHNLTTEEGEPIEVIAPGLLNTNQGPDFLDGRIRIGDTSWAGHIELHVHTADWFKHGHQHDLRYRNVMLHVIWEHDATAAAPPVPVLSLQSRVPKLLLRQYARWMEEPSFIPCNDHITQVPSLNWLGWKDRLLTERLQAKTARINTLLEESQNHWEEVCWWLMARGFGSRVNADAFEALARTIPINIIARYKNRLPVLEALLLGQAGLLEAPPQDDYSRLLQKEFRALQQKYRLQPPTIPVQLLRMRPGNFPAIRLAQLAALLHQSTHLFATIREQVSSAALRTCFSVTANDYWHYHYQPGVASAYKPKTLGLQMIHHLIINTVAPLLFAWGENRQEEAMKAKALAWLQETPAEKNNIISGYAQKGIVCCHAGDSQALLHLYHHYCSDKKCLSCAVGNHLLKQTMRK